MIFLHIKFFLKPTRKYNNILCMYDFWCLHINDWVLEIYLSWGEDWFPIINKIFFLSSLVWTRVMFHIVVFSGKNQSNVSYCCLLWNEPEEWLVLLSSVRWSKVVICCLILGEPQDRFIFAFSEERQMSSGWIRIQSSNLLSYLGRSIGVIRF